MNINLEALSQIPQMMKMIEDMKNIIERKNLEKRWLSTKEVIEYLPFGKDKIYKMIDIEFIEGEHFYRRENKLVFDIQKLDEWVIYSPINNTSKVDTKYIVDDVLSSLAS